MGGEAKEKMHDLNNMELFCSHKTKNPQKISLHIAYY